MIYLDTSIVVAYLFGETLRPPDALWDERLTSSRLLEYELLTQINIRRLSPPHSEAARVLLGRIALVELTPTVLARALDPFPTPVRALDALHLASLEFLRGHGHAIELASYDRRMTAAAEALKIPIASMMSRSL